MPTNDPINMKEPLSQVQIDEFLKDFNASSVDEINELPKLDDNGDEILFEEENLKPIPITNFIGNYPSSGKVKIRQRKRLDNHIEWRCCNKIMKKMFVYNNRTRMRYDAIYCSICKSTRTRST